MASEFRTRDADARLNGRVISFKPARKGKPQNSEDYYFYRKTCVVVVDENERRERDTLIQERIRDMVDIRLMRDAQDTDIERAPQIPITALFPHLMVDEDSMYDEDSDQPIPVTYSELIVAWYKEEAPRQRPWTTTETNNALSAALEILTFNRRYSRETAVVRPPVAGPFILNMDNSNSDADTDGASPVTQHKKPRLAKVSASEHASEHASDPSSSRDKYTKSNPNDVWTPFAVNQNDAFAIVAQMVGGRQVVQCLMRLNRATHQAIQTNDTLWHGLVETDFVKPISTESVRNDPREIYKDYMRFQNAPHVLLKDPPVVTPHDAVGVIRPLTGGIGLGVADCVAMFPQSWDGSLSQLFYWASEAMQVDGEELPKTARDMMDAVANLRKRLNFGICSQSIPLHEQFQDLLRLFPPSKTVHLSVERTLSRMHENEYILPGQRIPRDYSTYQYVVPYGATEVDSMAGEENAVLCLTQPETYMDSRRVEYYRQLLRSNKSCRPLIFVLDYGGQRFLLDGHHKFRAYLDEGFHPNYLVISMHHMGATRRNQPKYWDYADFMFSAYDRSYLNNFDQQKPTADEIALGVPAEDLRRIYLDPRLYLREG